MFPVLNQHSFVAVAVVVLAVVALVVRRRSRRTKLLAMAAVIALAVAYAALLRTGPGDVPAVANLDRVVGRGQPVALEFYSNY